VQSARKPRCIACGNCVVACPFGVAELYEDRQLMMKCDLCYDRTSIGKKPMCATVCPSQALSFMSMLEFERTRRGSAVNAWAFGEEEVRTKVYLVVPRAEERVHVDLVQLGGKKKAAEPDDVARLLEDV